MAATVRSPRHVDTRPSVCFAFFANRPYTHLVAIGLVTHEHIAALSEVAARLDAKGLADESRRVRAVLAALERAPRELPASAAADILAVTPQTVRNWVRGGLLPGRRDRTSHFYVPVDALEPAMRLREVLPDQPAGTILDEAIDAEIAAVRRERRECQAGTGDSR